MIAYSSKKAKEGKIVKVDVQFDNVIKNCDAQMIGISPESLALVIREALN